MSYEFEGDLYREPLRDYVVESPYFISSYEVYEDKIVINDAVWGEEVIGPEPGDEIFLKLAGHPLVSRLLNIEQLSLDYRHITMPNTSGYTRWESQWGSVAFVRKMTEGTDIDPRERTAMQLRTFLSDLGHTAFSHMGDWLFQGFGGPENQHDEELAELLRKSGVADILQQHGFELDEVVFPPTEDWVENDLPDLCVDRVDYGAREIRRWLDITVGFHDATRLEAFHLDEGRLVMRNYNLAKNFAVAFALLPTEHWAQPTHRLQLMLLQEAIKRMFIVDESLVVSWVEPVNRYHPRDYLYSVDTDFVGNLEKVDELNWLLSVIMKQIGFEQRRIFSTVRKRDLEMWVTNFAVSGTPGDFPYPTQSLTWQSRMHPLMPSNISLYPVETDSARPPFEESESGIAFYLPPLKPRYVNPLYYDEDGKIQRLSEADPNMVRFFAQQSEVMTQAYVALLHMNDEFRIRIAEGLRGNQSDWPAELAKPRMDADTLNELLRKSGDYAIGARKNRIFWHR